MILVDANVLLYAVNDSEPRNAEAREWLDTTLSGDETVGFAWIVILAFLRLSTKVGLFPRPLTVEEAVQQTRAWLGQPFTVAADPTPRHLDVLDQMLRGVGTGGNLVSDAHLAALALEYQATIVSYDADLGRFPGVSWRRPGE